MLMPGKQKLSYVASDHGVLLDGFPKEASGVLYKVPNLDGIKIINCFL